MLCVLQPLGPYKLVFQPLCAAVRHQNPHRLHLRPYLRQPSILQVQNQPILWPRQLPFDPIIYSMASNLDALCRWYSAAWVLDQAGKWISAPSIHPTALNSSNTRASHHRHSTQRQDSSCSRSRWSLQVSRCCGAWFSARCWSHALGFLFLLRPISGDAPEIPFSRRIESELSPTAWPGRLVQMHPFPEVCQGGRCTLCHLLQAVSSTEGSDSVFGWSVMIEQYLDVQLLGCIISPKQKSYYIERVYLLICSPLCNQNKNCII